MKQDIVVIGGGIVGLATALKIKQKQPKLRVTLLEKEDALGQHQTGHNSGVIHSGIYYKPGSLKAINCKKGYHQLLAYCDKKEIPYELCGKIIVATTPEEIPALDRIMERGIQNGLENLKKLSAEDLPEYEPHVNGIAGIWVPQTGIIDYLQVCRQYARDFQEVGGEIALGNKVTDIQYQNEICTVVTSRTSYEAKLIVNCAGLYSDKIARISHEKLGVKIIPFRGEYFEIKSEKQYLVKNLIYPVPDPNFPFLGVHFTRMIHGGVEAGPNAVLAFRREGYHKADINVSELAESLAWPGFHKVAYKYWRTGFGEMYRSFSKSAFTKALQKLIPEIQKDDLIAGGAGVRAQACDRNGNLIDDFLIIEDTNAVHVCNAPSPGATSSLSIGETVADKVLSRYGIKKETVL